MTPSKFNPQKSSNNKPHLRNKYYKQVPEDHRQNFDDKIFRPSNGGENSDNSRNARYTDQTDHTGNNYDYLNQRGGSKKSYTNGINNKNKAEGYDGFRNKRSKNNNVKWGLVDLNSNQNNSAKPRETGNTDRFSETNIVFTGPTC